MLLFDTTWVGVQSFRHRSFPVALYFIADVLFFTSVCSCASATGSSSDCQVVIWSYRFGESNRFISFDFKVKLLAFEGEESSILAFPLLEQSLLVTVVQANFTPHRFPLGSQALFGHDSKKPVTGCPAHLEAAITFLQQTKTSGLVDECEWGLCREM